MRVENCNKCRTVITDYYSLKGTKLSAGRLGIAFKYCKKCFDDLKILIHEYIETENKTELKCSCLHVIGGKCINQY